MIKKKMRVIKCPIGVQLLHEEKHPVRNSIILILFGTLAGYTQAPSWQWVNQTPFEYSRIQNDGSHNIYLCGAEISSQSGQHEIHMACFTQSGTRKWEKTIVTRGPGNSLYMNDLNMETDPSGNSYVSFSYRATDIVAGTLTVTTPEANRQELDVCILKVNASGMVEWVRRFGTIYQDYISRIRLTPSYDLIAYGRYTSYAPLIIGNDTLPCHYSDDIFIAKIDASGNHIWTKAMDDGTWDIPWNIQVDQSGTIYETYCYDSGRYKLVKRSATGIVAWVRPIELRDYPYHFSIEGDRLFVSMFGKMGVQIFDTSGTKIGDKNFNAVQLNDMKVKNNSVFYSGAFFSDTIKAGGWELYNTYTLQGNHGSYHGPATLLAEADTAGKIKWMKSLNGNCDHLAAGILPLPGDGVYVCGWAGASVQFDGQTMGSGRWNFVGKLDPANPVGVLKQYDTSTLKIFPNPAVDHMNIELPDHWLKKDIVVLVTDVTGRIVYCMNYLKDHRIDISHLKTGCYFVEIHREDNVLARKKMLIE
jgi:hypothetical protein